MKWRNFILTKLKKLGNNKIIDKARFNPNEGKSKEEQARKLKEMMEENMNK